MAEVQLHQGLRNFSALLDHCIETSNLSQREFAKVTQLSQTRISNWLKNGSQNGKWTAPSYENTIKLAPLLFNPKTKTPFTPSQLFALISGEVRYTNDEIKQSRLIPPQTQSEKILSDYWKQIVQRDLGKAIQDLGEPSEQGFTLQSRDFTFNRSNEGLVAITPKDGSPPLTKERLTKKHVKIINEVVKVAKEHSQKSTQAPSLTQPEKKRKIKM